MIPDGHPLPSPSRGIPQDAEARAQAIDPSRSFIVQAPAGSGKTELLTQRFLRLLGYADKPEEIVAITFTRKAAAEMRERLLHALQAGHDDLPPVDAHKRHTWELARNVLRRDARQGWKIEHNPGRLRIQTIDSLCASLVRQLPIVSGLGSALDPVEDAEDLYQQAARSTLGWLDSDRAELSDALARVVQHLDNDLSKVEGLIVTMLAKRDQWMPYASSEEGFRDHLEGCLERLVREEIALADELIPFGVWPEWLTLTRYATHNLEGSFPWDRRPQAVPDDLPIWSAMAGVLLTRDGNWRKEKGFTKVCGFPAGGSAAEKAECKDWKHRACALVASFEEDAALAERLHNLRSLPPTRYSDDQWHFLEALFQVLRVAVGELYVAFGERESVDFVEIAQRALQALGTPEEPTDSALTLDASIRHLLVDEFQDTSLSQRRLLEQLVSGWQQDDGRTLFLVGDPMQSIYRFRNAEVGIFLEARGGELGGIALTSLALTVNFRCQSGLVDWFNRVFAEVFPQHEDRVHGGVPYAPSSAARAELEGQAVVHHAFPQGGGREEADRMVELIRAAREHGTVGVLVRGRSHLVELLPRLRRAEIDFSGVEIEALMGRTVVLDLLALTRALVHVGNRPAWLAVLRSPWCGLSLDDMHRLLHDDGQEVTVFEAASDPTRRRVVSRDGQRRLARVVPVLTTSLAEQGRSSLRSWVETTWVALGGPACCSEPGELEDAESYLSFLEGFDDGCDLESLESLEQSLKDLKARPNGSASGQVQIMTIHKAKGLEFDTVLLPGLARMTGRDDPRLFRWLERPSQGPGRSDLLLAPIRSADTEEDPTYRLLQRLDDKKSEHENLRLLYVAVTRARRHLHLLFELKTDDSDAFVAPHEKSLLCQLWPQIQHDVLEARLDEAARRGEAIMAGEASEDPPTEMAAERAAVPLVRLPADWSAPAARPAPAEETADEPVEGVSYDWARENLRKVGVVVHQFLQMVGRQGVEAWPLERVRSCEGRLRAALFGGGIGPDQLDECTGRALRALTQTVADERGRWILSSSHSDIRCEHALRGKGLRHGVIDRTFVDASGQRWLVDYKTSYHEGGGIDAFLEEERRRYLPQLERYAELLQLQYGQPVRCGLYFPLLGRWLEIGGTAASAVA